MQLEDYPELWLDGVSYRLRQETDLRWLSSYGRVFKVFDRLTSGNICFGVQGPYGKLFIKFAGARPVNFGGRPLDAVNTLYRAMPLYQFGHPALTRLLAHGPAGEGYAAVFAWREGEPLRPLPVTDETKNKVHRLRPERALNMLDMVYDLHAMLAYAGLIAVDFCDENLLIDFDRNEAVVCDIDLYRQRPTVNDRGRMPGSSRYMAPEEYTLGAALDEATTVYNLGALAFDFFGDNLDRSRESWFGPGPLYEVAAMATQKKRLGRYPSVGAFLSAWRETVSRLRLG